MEVVHPGLQGCWLRRKRRRSFEEPEKEEVVLEAEAKCYSRC
jgi:hypothetical protein